MVLLFLVCFGDTLNLVVSAHHVRTAGRVYKSLAADAK